MEFKQIEERLESISEQLEEEKEQRLFNERRERFRMYQELERQKELKEAEKGKDGGSHYRKHMKILENAERWKGGSRLGGFPFFLFISERNDKSITQLISL